MTQKTGEFDATPKKKTLREQADAAPLQRCVAELIDNCIDFWRHSNIISKDKPPLNIWLKIDRDQKAKESPKPINHFSMKWNMDIPKDKIENVLRPGSESIDEEGMIGLWGQGAKIAMHGLAHGWILTTIHKKQKIEVTCPSNWIMDEENWKLPYKESDDNKENSDETVFNITKLHPKKWSETKKDEEYFDEYENITINERISKHISERYGEFGDHGVSIFINDEPIELIPIISPNSLKRNYLWIPGFEPHVDDWGAISLSGDRKLKIQIFVGMHRDPNQYEAGVYLYGNGRRFIGAAKKAPLFKSYSPKDVNIRLHVFIDGHARDIPWGIPEKDGLNDTHPTIRTIANYIKKSYEPYSQIVTLEKNQRYLYTLNGPISTLVKTAGYDGNNATTMEKLLKNLREINSEELQFHYVERFSGRHNKPECLNSQFKDEINGILFKAKTDENYLKFHIKLAKISLLSDLLLDGIKVDDIKVDEHEDEEEQEAEQDETEAELEEEPEKNKDISYTQTTIDDFDSSLNELGNAVGIRNKDILMVKLSKAVKKMAKELTRPGYITRKGQFIKELLDIE
jgi:hypothetical protein